MWEVQGNLTSFSIFETEQVEVQIKIKNRQIIHYALIAFTLLIQIGVLIFFYNDYFNEKKLSAIEKQIKESKTLSNLTKRSREELLLAQDNLQKYNTTGERQYLDNYFEALRQLNDNVENINAFEFVYDGNKQKQISKNKQKEKLSLLKSLIDSIYIESQKAVVKTPNPKISKFELKNNPEQFEIAVHYKSDTVAKKSLLPRLKDAIKGNIEVRRDTAYITSKYYKSTVDTSQLQNQFDSTITAINNYYQKAIKQHQDNFEATRSKSDKLYHVYDNLIVLSNDLMMVYNDSVNDFNSDLQARYDEQNSINNSVRKYGILSLMILMFFVLIVIMYYTKLAFHYEKQLRLANQEINNNLNFKNRILGMLSHEIRSPLKIINIFIDRITRKSTDEKIIDYLKSIKFTNDSLMIQASQILEYTKNQEIEIRLKPVEFDLKTEVDNIIKAFQPYIESRKNEFEIDNTLSSNLIVFADEAKIHQLFINILGNANKFTENGKISIFVESEPVDDSNIKFKVCVKDTGIGISKSDLKKIFESYYQGVVSDNIENLGAGLGLNLCKEIVGLFGGTISAESILGKGTTLSFAINLKIKNESI